MTRTGSTQHTLWAPGIYQIPADEYHHGPLATTTLSSTGARLLLPPSCPALYRHTIDHPDDREPTDALDFGQAAHQHILGDTDNHVVIVESPNWYTKTAREQRAAARREGLTPILRKHWNTIETMAAAVRADPLAAALLRTDNGTCEQTLIWDDQSTGVTCRARIDWLPNKTPGRPLILTDLKTAASAHPETWARSAADYGYYCQAAWYIDGIRALGIDDNPQFAFVVVEKTPPHLTKVIFLDDTAISLGRSRNRAAINTYAECTRTGMWPGYSPIGEPATVSLPDYHLRRYGETPEEPQ